MRLLCRLFQRHCRHEAGVVEERKTIHEVCGICQAREAEPAFPIRKLGAVFERDSELRWGHEGTPTSVKIAHCAQNAS